MTTSMTQQDLHRPFLELGFEDVSTGGGCRALQKKVEHRGVALDVLVTDDDLGVPRVLAPIYVGVWDGRTGDFLTGQTYSPSEKYHLLAADGVTRLLDKALDAPEGEYDDGPKVDEELEPNERTELVGAIKAEVIRDAGNGVVPRTVKSFAELHDHVDANMYGASLLGSHGLTEERQTDELNRAFTAVDAWLKEGGLTRALNFWQG